MQSSPGKQIRNLKSKANESELKPLVESTDKPVPRIRRIPTKLIRDSASEDKESGESSKQRILESGETSKPSREASTDIITYKVEKLEESHPRFGPLYTVDQEPVDAIKEKAWGHVLQKSSERNATKEVYLAAMRKVEQDAKEMYAGKASGSGSGSEFRLMMIKDGCFFLQLALLILGCSEQLGYPPNDPIFGRVQKKKDLKKWIEAMFYVGNQIPLVVLRELMDQTFFQEVIAKAKWDPLPSGLCKKVLYDVLVLPAIGEKQGRSLMQRVMGRGNDVEQQQQLCDMLHGFRNLLMGPATQDLVTSEYEADDQIDLEANEDETGDYDGIFPETTSPGDIGNRLRNFLNAMGFPDAVDNRKRIFPSVTELKRAGIHIKKLKTGGARGIHYESYYFWAYLYLPAFAADDNAEVILQNLKNYDNFQQSGQNGPEVSSYLRFMSDLIQTTRDVKLLQNKGILNGKLDDVEKLPAMLKRLSSEDIRLTQELRMLRSQIRDHSSPWIHYKGVINLVVFLTIIQTLFALLAYFKPPK